MEAPEDPPENCASVDQPLAGKSIKLDFKIHLDDKEEKLKPNANSIKQTLKELQAKMEDLRSESPPNSTECLKWFPFRMHFRPVATGYQEQLDFLRALQLYLRSEEDGKEGVTLELLMDLSSHCGVCFPCTPSPSYSSTSYQPDLINTVRDESSIEIQTVWDDVRLQLRRHLLDRLSAHIPELPEPGRSSTPSIPERIYCLQQLFLLYPESEVLAHYQTLRSQFTMALLHSTLSSSLSGETGFDRLAVGFCSVVPVLTHALNEELHVLSRFVEQHTILRFLNEAYLGTVAQELESLMEKESETALRDNTTVTSKIKKYSARSWASAGNERERKRHRTVE